MNPKRIAELGEFYRDALLGDTLPFWTKHGVDRVCGGFLTHLTREGRVWCTDKPVWFAGRATWLFATLHNQLGGEGAWLELARHGEFFLTRHGFDADGRMYFLLDRAGRPLRKRRYHYSEVFAALAYGALAQMKDAAAEAVADWRARAVGVFERLARALTAPSGADAKVNPDVRPMKGLSPVMCLLGVADALRPVIGAERAEPIIDAAIREVLEHFVRPEDESIREAVSPDGALIDAPEGRVMNPGHAIETAWFLMEIARRRSDQHLLASATRILDWSIARGWDSAHGGLLYFIDVEGLPSPYLEHDMKLWWPHCEALYALLLAHHLTGRAEYAEQYERMHAWTMAHFPDPEHGEWYGYLHRDGTPASTMKGGLWKGPFHVPRAQLMCMLLLEEMARDGACA